MALRCPPLLIAAAFTTLHAGCTLDREGTGELWSGADSSVGGFGGTPETGGMGGTSVGGGGSGGTAGQGGTAGSSAVGGNDAGTDATAGAGGTDTGGTAGGGGAGGTAGGAGGTEAGAGDAATVEVDCLNGIDDDQNGVMDCADPACSDYECVAAAPTDWHGFYRIRELPWSDPPPPIEPCPNGLQAQRYFQDASGAMSCVCGCESLTGATCAAPKLGCATNDSCSSVSDWTSALADGSCHKPGIGNASSLSCTLLDNGSVANSGSCQPTVTKTSAAPFAVFVDVCDSGSGAKGCFAGYECAAKGSGAYASRPCVAQPANATCPLGWGARHFAFGSYEDTRSCTACACTPQVTCSGGAYAVYDDNDCATGANSIGDMSCHDASGELDFGTWSIRLTAGAAAGGQCVASGGEPTGALTTENPVTFCCQQ